MGIFRGFRSAFDFQKTTSDELSVAELSPIFQYSFEYTVDNTELTRNITTGGGNITQADAMGVVSTSATAGSTACLQTVRQARIRPGQGAIGAFDTLFETGGVTGTVQYAGLVDKTGVTESFENGYVVGFTGTEFGFHIFQNDVKFSTPISEWDDPLDGSGKSFMEIDTSELNFWRIQFSLAGLMLWVFNYATGAFIKAHTIRNANKKIAPSIFMPNLRLMIFADNKAAAVDLVVKAESMSYFVEGKTEPILVHQPSRSSDIQTKTGVTDEIAIFTIRNKAIYAGKQNFIEAILQDFVCSIEASSANNLGALRIVRNAALGGTPVWSDINATNSVMEIDTSATTVIGGKLITAVTLSGKNDDKDKPLLELKENLAAGESVTVAGSSANSATINSALLLKELF
jgi:hypothetical protein